MMDASKTLAHALVSSRLNHDDTLLCGLSSTLLEYLQSTKFYSLSSDPYLQKSACTTSLELRTLAFGHIKVTVQNPGLCLLNPTKETTPQYLLLLRSPKSEALLTVLQAHDVTCVDSCHGKAKATGCFQEGDDKPFLT